MPVNLCLLFRSSGSSKVINSIKELKKSFIPKYKTENSPEELKIINV